MRILFIAILVLIINIPFGIWRSSQSKFSFKWFLAIHLPVPFVIILRIYSDIGFGFYTYPILVGAFFLGQLLGSKIPKFC